MKILIIKLSSIGDVVHTLPSLYAIRQRYPDAVIDWLVEEAASDIIKGHNLLNDCIIVKRKKWLKKPLSIDTWRNAAAVVRILRSKSYDIVIDFQGLVKSGIWAFLSKGKRRIGFSNTKELSGIFLNEALPPYNPDIHAVDRYLSLAKHIGAETANVEFPMPHSESEMRKAVSILKAKGIWEGQPFVVVNPMARWETKLWGNEMFALLCNMVMDKFGSKIVLTGSASMYDEIEKIKSLTDKLVPEGFNRGRAINLAGMTGLKELTEIINLSKMVVTVDSGPMHIAAAIGKPVVALFGPTAPWRTGPYGDGHIVVRKELDCSPCFLKKCKNLKCMKDIKVEDVMTAVEKQLNLQIADCNSFKGIHC